jgi:hypothetical protein
MIACSVPLHGPYPRRSDLAARCTLVKPPRPTQPQPLCQPMPSSPSHRRRRRRQGGLALWWSLHDRRWMQILGHDGGPSKDRTISRDLLLPPSTMSVCSSSGSEPRKLQQRWFPFWWIGAWRILPCSKENPSRVTSLCCKGTSVSLSSRSRLRKSVPSDVHDASFARVRL